MEMRRNLEILPAGECDCCRAVVEAADGLGEPYGCAERKGVFTVREQRVLERIRQAREMANGIKKEISRLDARGAGASEERARAENELESLRRLRTELETERLAAAEERMRLLGHA